MDGIIKISNHCRGNCQKIVQINVRSIVQINVRTIHKYKCPNY
jgi:hypothetical protein